jgi:hypothetical protein
MSLRDEVADQASALRGHPAQRHLAEPREDRELVHW